ncbi:hypothetical protein CWI38_2681p0010, partial [Hamiltosporidium tvaerminnensis]
SFVLFKSLVINLNCAVAETFLKSASKLLITLPALLYPKPHIIANIKSIEITNPDAIIIAFFLSSAMEHGFLIYL